MNYAKVVTVSILTLFIMLLGTSCSTKLTSYNNTLPAFNIQSYFNGPLIAWGIIQDRNQKVTRRFCVELQGTWQQDKGTLKEKFYFDDGEVSYRNWQLTRSLEGAFTGKAEDVIGEAKGQQSGYAFQWQYELAITIDSSIYHFNLDDWMFRIDDYRAFNKTEMKKFGLTVAEITLFFDKEIPLRHCQMNKEISS